MTASPDLPLIAITLWGKTFWFTVYLVLAIIYIILMFGWLNQRKNALTTPILTKSEGRGKTEVG